MGLEHKSLDRGITVLEMIARNGSCSLAELHNLTGISKSSIRRLLATLVDRRLVRRSLADGRYRTSVLLSATAGRPVPADMAFVVDVALPHVIALTNEIGWPSDIHLLEGDCMRIVDSTRPLSPFHLYRVVVDMRVNIFGSATGTACLAAMPDSAFEKIAAHTMKDSEWGLNRYGLTVEQYRSHLEGARKRGYGTRGPRFMGNTTFDDGLAAIAIPVFWKQRVYGAISLLWPKVYMKPEEFAREHIGRLMQTAATISDDLERLQPKLN
ncbi:MAG: helix-turn-helix domain-containing protein [Rhizobiaceae bacterium]|nr:helix-turn-helix domain-containing protein [Rhizobiaceae bacterium]